MLGPRRVDLSDRVAPLSVVSLFSGCGGLDLGFRSAGFEMLYACDSDPAAVAIYRRNLGDHVVERDVNDEKFVEDLKAIGSCDVLLGGFPCQGFSKAGPKRPDDERNSLYLRMRLAVDILRPKVFLAENVDGIQQNFEGIFVQRIKDGFRFDNEAYDVDFRLVDAHAYGVPQYRRRAFFVGVRESLGQAFSWPEPTHQHRERNGNSKISHLPLFEAEANRANLPAPRTIQDAIGDIVRLDARVPDHKVTGKWPEKYRHVFSSIGAGQKLCNVRHADTSVYTWQIPEVFGHVSERQRMILETISRHRRHRRYGNIPNGNPLPVPEIERLSRLSGVNKEIPDLISKGYLKPVGDAYDLMGAMFCSGLFKRPLWHEPAPTILTNFHNPRFFLHPSEHRPFTLRECARLQSFDDSFEFESAGVSLVDAYRLVGNAVPPRLGQEFAAAMCKFLSERQGGAILARLSA